MPNPPIAIRGVVVHPLTTHPDSRGSFTEAFRREWGLGIDPLQWNVVKSNRGTLRGIHVHPTHTDMLVMIAGTATIGLHDLRVGSPTQGSGSALEASGDRMCAVVIPPGVAHGFLFHEPSVMLYAVSHYWDTEDELAVHWADPGLGIAWPLEPTLVSERDAAAGTLSDLVAQLAPLQPIGRSDR